MQAPASQDSEVVSFNPFRTGLRYLSFLGLLSEARAPRTYFEIGTSVGNSLALVNCASVSVDPNYRVSQNVIGKKPVLMSFQMTSDDFFAQHDLGKLFPGVGAVDFAFLDGMHHFEFLFRDFINTEKHCHAGSVVVLHDCLPIRPFSARRLDGKKRDLAQDTRRPVGDSGGGWTGDVWKVLRILQENRPDLTIHVFDCPPSSLVVITGCDPANKVLSDRYDSLVERWMHADTKPGWFDALHDDVDLLPSRQFATADKIAELLALRPLDQ